MKKTLLITMVLFTSCATPPKITYEGERNQEGKYHGQGVITYSNGEKSKACNSYNNKGIKNIVENKFNNDLYLDSNDLFNRRNSQRQFYTMPNTSIPNKQGDFAKWLYDRGPTCKEGNCTTSSGGWGASPAPSSR